MTDFCQSKIINLEKGLVKELDNVISRKSIDRKATLYFYDKGRKETPEGFYIYNVQLLGKSSHGILIQKKRYRGERSTLHIFDPNGQQSANVGDYKLNTKINGTKEYLDSDISPLISWNNSGNCGVWCLIIPILYKYFKQSEISKFYYVMSRRWNNQDINANFWITYIVNKYINESSYRYNAKSQRIEFIEKMQEEIKLAIKNFNKNKYI